MIRGLISEREKELPVSTIGNLISIAEEGKDIISLGAGELDYSSPPEVIRAAKASLERGETHYSPPRGRQDLRESISRKLKKDNKIKVGPEQVIVTSGATEGILLSLMCTVDPGEGVLLPDPGFLAFKPVVEVLNGMPIPFGLREGFSYDIDDMERATVTEKTRVIIINSPSNPTGAVLRRRELEEIADFAVNHSLFIVSDEAYEKFVYGVKHVSIGSLNGMEDRVVTLQSFSKSFAMPGFRIGYAAGPENLINAMAKLHVFSSICAPTVSQVAALAALKNPKTSERMVKEYDKRRKFIWKRVSEIDGFNCAEPRGAFYIFPKFTFKKTSLKLAEILLRKAKVAVVPGTEFGKRGEGFIRLSYATKLPDIKKALEKIGKAVKNIN